jgi:HD-like signal output (HDOD) protein
MATIEPIVIDPNTFLKTHCQLPPLPKALVRIQERLNSDDLEIKEVVQLLSAEPVLVAQILKIVNSAYYSLPREISEISFAVAYLGLNEIYRLVLSLSVINTLSIADKHELERFWHHSYYTAICTKYLAKKYQPLLPQEELWAAAILHDIGKIVYLKFFPQHYKALHEHRDANRCLFTESEEQMALPKSGYLGSLLCARWQLPSKIKAVCEKHTIGDLVELDGKSETKSFQRIICIANLAVVLATESLEEEAKKKISASIMSALGISGEQFLLIMGSVSDLKIETDNFQF